MLGVLNWNLSVYAIARYYIKPRNRKHYREYILHRSSELCIFQTKIGHKPDIL